MRYRTMLHFYLIEQIKFVTQFGNNIKAQFANERRHKTLIFRDE